MKKFGFFLAGLLSLWLVFVLLTPLFVDVDQYRETLRSRVQRAVGGEVKFGKLRLSLLKGVAVRGNELSWKSDQAGTLRAKNFELLVPLSSLLFGDTQVEVRVSNGTLKMKLPATEFRSAVGGAAFLATQSLSQGVKKSVNRPAPVGSWLDRTLDEARVFLLFEQFRLLGPSGSLVENLRFVGEDTRGSGASNFLLSADGSHQLFGLKIDGRIKLKGGFVPTRVLSLEADLSNARIRYLTWFDKPANELADVKVKFVANEDQTISIKDGKMNIANAEFSMKGNLASKDRDFDLVFKSEEIQAKEFSKAVTFLDADSGSFNLRGKFFAKQGKFDRIFKATFSSIQTQFPYKVSGQIGAAAGKDLIAKLAARTDRGKISLLGGIRREKDQFQIDVSGDGISLERFFGKDLEGDLSAAAKIQGEGLRRRDILKNLKAIGNVEVKNAVFRAEDLGHLVTKTVNKNLGDILKKAGAKPLDPLKRPKERDYFYENTKAKLKVFEGKLAVTSFAATPKPDAGIEVKGDGTVDLDSGKLLAKLLVRDRYNLSGAHDLSVNLGKTKIEKLLVVNGAVEVPVDLACQWDKPCASFDRSSEALVAAAVGNVNRTLKDPKKRDQIKKDLHKKVKDFLKKDSTKQLLKNLGL